MLFELIHVKMTKERIEDLYVVLFEKYNLISA